MTVYIDSDFKCHTEPAEDRTAVETEAFDGRCKAFIEGYRFVPAGQSWARDDGVVFNGEMLSPWVDSRELETVQAEHERHQLALTQEALNIAMGVTT